jgi:hypothetical protein
MKFAALLFLSLTSVSAFASERIVNIDVFNNKLQLAGNVSKIKLKDIHFYKAESKVKIIEEDYCGESSFCDRRIILERVPALRVTVSYFTPGSMDDDGEQWVDLNLPVNLLSKEDLALLKKNTTIFDLLQRRARARQVILRANFEVAITERSQVIQVLDYQRSTICSIDDGPYCREELFYVPKTIKLKDVVVNKK